MKIKITIQQIVFGPVIIAIISGLIYLFYSMWFTVWDCPIPVAHSSMGEHICDDQKWVRFIVSFIVLMFTCIMTAESKLSWEITVPKIFTRKVKFDPNDENWEHYDDFQEFLNEKDKLC